VYKYGRVPIYYLDSSVYNELSPQNGRPDAVARLRQARLDRQAYTSMARYILHELVLTYTSRNRDKLRDVLLTNTSRLGSYAALKGRFILPDGPPFYEFMDIRVLLKNMEESGKGDSLTLQTEIAPETMAGHWYGVPIPPGTWNLVVVGARIKTWTCRLHLTPGQSVDLGDIRLASSL
jgi:hypothetical protein